jgi:hypothetical protein
MIEDYPDYVLSTINGDICRASWFDEHAFKGDV